MIIYQYKPITRIIRSYADPRTYEPLKIAQILWWSRKYTYRGPTAVVFAARVLQTYAQYCRIFYLHKAIINYELKTKIFTQLSYQTASV